MERMQTLDSERLAVPLTCHETLSELLHFFVPVFSTVNED